MVWASFLIAIADCLPQVPVFFGNFPSYKSPLTLRAADSADSADSVDALDGAALEAKPKE